jgi:phosphate transport system substrate-binding protein
MNNSMLWVLAFATVLAGCSSRSPGGNITIDGSATVYPLSKAMEEAFQQGYPSVRVKTAFSGTGGGFRKFCAGEVDIESASRPINEAEIA